MNPDTTGVDLMGLAVAVGRIEEKLTGMSSNETRTGERLDRLEARTSAVESLLVEMKAQQRPKAPWWVVVGGVAGTVTAILGFWTLFQLATQLATAMP